MKKIALWNRYPEFANNRLFMEEAYGIGEDLGRPIIELKESIEKRGYVVETLDMDKSSRYEKVIFFDYPDENSRCCALEDIPFDRRYLVLSECEMIYGENARRDLLRFFNKVFTYDDDLVKGCGYIKLNIPNVIKKPLIAQKDKQKLITLIAGNKTSDKDGELYGKRLNFIRYMEAHHPDEFEFYGTGWLETTFTGSASIFNHFSFLRRAFAEKHPCYHGSVEKKNEVQSRYKFVLAYENTCAIPGYISEKLWDVFFSGAVPVYFGAPNILDYVPENCFIDARKFNSDDEIYKYIKGISEHEYDEYLENIAGMLASDVAKPFSSDYFCNTIIENVISAQ